MARKLAIPLVKPRRAADPVGAYAWDVCNDKIVTCRMVRLSCERHFRDLATGGKRNIRFSLEHAAFAITFFRRFLRHSKGEWGGKPVQLEPWQEFAIGSVYGWLKKDGTRRFHTAYSEIARKNGKALDIGTPVPTPAGWKRHGDLRVGDYVFDPSGRPILVEGTTSHYPGPCYEVRFSDGETIVAHAKHEWRTRRTMHTGRRQGSRAPLPLVETEDIANTLRHSARGDFTHGIWTCAPLELPDLDLPVPPYTFGAWLGDGDSLSAAITSADLEVVEAIAAEGIPVSELSYQSVGLARRYTFSTGIVWNKPGAPVPLRTKLIALGVLGNKHVPAKYLRASISQRRELLAGIVDTDGHVTARGQCEVALTSEKLFYGAVDLARTLGYKPTVKIDRATLNGRDIGPRYRMQFWPALGELPLRIQRKRERLRRVPAGRSRTRMIVGCDAVGDRTVNCIQVQGGMYLAGEAMVPTHNSLTASGVGLYGLICDGEPGAEVYAAATKREQARIVFDEAKKMVRASAELMKMVRVFKLNISIDQTGSKFEPLSADSRSLDGLNPSCVIIDELHKHRDRSVLDVLDTAVGSRRQPLFWIITTAGDDNQETVYAQENAYARQVLEGVVADDGYFALIYTLDKDDDWQDQTVWIKANPNLGISVKLSDLKRMAFKAAQSPAALVAFKRLRLNVRTSDATRYINMEHWRQNTMGRFDPRDLADREFYGGIDLSSRVDLSAFVKLFPPIEGEPPVWRVVVRLWMPGDTVHEKSSRDAVQYQRWIDNGWIEPTIGNIIDHSEIMRCVQEDCRQFRAISIAYDPWNAAQMAGALTEDGAPMYEFIQGLKSYTAPTKELEAMLTARKLDHGDNPVLDWMAYNLHVQVDKNDNRMPTKEKSIGRIDGMSALIMAIGRSMADDPLRGIEGALSGPMAA